MAVFAAQPVLSAFDRAVAEGQKKADAGQFSEALPAFARAERLAREANDLDKQAIALIWTGKCEMLLFRYRAAVESFETGGRLANEASDPTRAGIAAGNAGQVYGFLGDFQLAEKEQQDAIRLLDRSTRQDALAKAWLDYASLQIREGKISEGKQAWDRAIAVAKSAQLAPIEALALDQRGISALLEGDTSKAERDLNAAHSIFQFLHDKDGIAITLEHLAELELKKQNYQLASKYIDGAFAEAGPLFRSSEPYYPIHVRAQILLGLGHESDALTEFRRAVEAATLWRQSAMPGDASSTQTVALLHDVYHDYAQLGAELALEHHDSELSRQAWETLAINRAANLREQLTLAYARNSRLPPRYFELLSELAIAQAQVTFGRSSSENEQKLKNIRLELSALEDQIGLEDENLLHPKEKNTIQNSLRSIQFRLGKDEALLSFSLGKQKSFLWAISGSDVNLYQLPAESEIAAAANAFSSAVKNGQSIAPAGSLLSRTLFAKLPDSIWQKKRWLISADGPLLSGVPFGALPDLSVTGHSQLLNAGHTLRSLPSELFLLQGDKASMANRFVGVADPIYNLADSRRTSHVSFVASANMRISSLGRLPGTDREIRTAAKQSGFGQTELLVGANANIGALRNALASPTAVLHFALHVVNPNGEPDEAALALSLNKENIPELLTPEAIASLRVPGSLVVMSGCSSDQGRAVPSAGLIGLSRAWLVAGADAVLVSAWPTPDDSGPFFSNFYSHLANVKSGSLSSRAATALQLAQLDMQRSTGFRSSSSFWAAYSIVSKE